MMVLITNIYESKKKTTHTHPHPPIYSFIYIVLELYIIMLLLTLLTNFLYVKIIYSINEKKNSEN